MSGNSERREGWLVGYMKCPECEYIQPIIVDMSWQMKGRGTHSAIQIKREYLQRYIDVYVDENGNCILQHIGCNRDAIIIPVEELVN